MSATLGAEAPPSDFHVHTKLSWDATKNSLEAVISVAAALSFRQIGLADHVQAASEGALGFERAPEPVEPHQALARRVYAIARDCGCSFVLRSMGLGMAEFLDHAGFARSRAGHRRTA